MTIREPNGDTSELDSAEPEDLPRYECQPEPRLLRFDKSKTPDKQKCDRIDTNMDLLLKAYRTYLSEKDEGTEPCDEQPDPHPRKRRS